MSYARLKQRLAAGEVLLLDGPTGTELQRRGAAMDPAAWCGPATLQHDRLLTEIHADYIAAGAAVVTANTYASSRLMLTGAGLADIAGLIPTAGVDAAGVMHTNAALVEESLGVVRRRFAGPLMAYPDSGYFEAPDWRFVDSMSPARFEEFCRRWISSGVQLIGGCCGLSVEHIRAA